MIRCITLWPEWAHAIVHLGKRVENRGAQPQPRVGERLAIHAGARIGGRSGRPATVEGMQALELMAAREGIDLQTRVDDRHRERAVVRAPALSIVHLPGEREVQCSAIVALARVAAIHPPGEGPTAWRVPGSHAWELADVVVLRDPLTGVTGAQGLWKFGKLTHRATPEQLYAELRVRDALARGFEVLNAGGERFIERAATRTALGTAEQVLACRRHGPTPLARVIGDERALTEAELAHLVAREIDLNAKARARGERSAA